ncbi:TSUP family transporter [Amycolatopsis thailandensis]|uniref:TSUP family transporter n=1 Tax=Amycolatopsis thailandensis TaxID=589330 RepID=UPI003635B86B
MGTLAMTSLAAAAGVVAQRLSGMGLSLLCVPFLALTLGPLDAVRLTLLLGFPVYLAVAVTHWRAIRWAQVVWLTVPAVVFTPVVALVVRGVPERPLLLAAGGCCVLAVGVLASGITSGRLAGRTGAVGAGVLSAAMNSVAGLSGPAVAVYGASAGWGADETRGTLSIYFFLLGLVALPSLGWVEVPASVLLAVAGAALAGDLLGRALSRRVGERSVRWSVLLLSAAGGALTLAHAV